MTLSLKGTTEVTELLKVAGEDTTMTDKNVNSRSRNKMNKPNETRYNDSDEVEGAVLRFLDHVFTDYPEKRHLTFRARHVVEGRFDFRGRGLPNISKARIHQVSIWLNKNIDTVLGGRYYLQLQGQNRKKGKYYRVIVMDDDDFAELDGSSDIGDDEDGTK